MSLFLARSKYLGLEKDSILPISTNLVLLSMLKISKLADYATVMMNFLAANPEQLFSAAEMAEKVQIAAPTVSKISKLLSEAHLVSSVRGSNGGYRIARPPQAISLLEVITAVDGVPSMTECSKHTSICVQDACCAVKHNWRLINQVILNALQSVTLADMAGSLMEHPLIMQGLTARAIQTKVSEH